MNYVHSVICQAVLVSFFSLTISAQNKPNVLMIALDDQNDWVGAFGGNPQVLTPNMDKLCNQPGVVFTNAHCTGPKCGPSRSSLLSGFRPETTGCYENDQNMIHSDLIQQYATMPEYFSKNGYLTISKGKIFHRHPSDQGEWAFEIWEPVSGKNTPIHNKLTSRNDELINGVKEENPKYSNKNETPFPWELGDREFAWGPSIEPKEETVDYKTAKWAENKLQADYDQPFFMAIGFAKPHDPFFVPQEYFDLYDLEKIKLPEFRLDDLDDILTPGGKRKFKPTNDFMWVMQDEQLFKSAIRGYLATISYVDDCVGIVLDALQKSKYAENTIIIVFGDNGWHLGEKLKFAKNTGWSESTRVPLIVKTPLNSKPSTCNRVVNLIDLYPTLIDLCGLPKRDVIAGRSLVPLLSKPNKKWPYPSVTTIGIGSYTVNNKGWRYIRYQDGTEELYDLKNDPMEWNNLITSDNKNAAKSKTKLQKWAPKTFAPELPENTATVHELKDKTETTTKIIRSPEKLK